MKKIGTSLLVLAIIAVIGLNSVSLGTSLKYSVEKGDEFFYEFKYAKYSLADQVLESEKNAVNVGMVKISILDFTFTNNSAGDAGNGLLKERIWYRETTTGWESVSSEKTFNIMILNQAPYNISIFGSTALIDGEVDKSVISSFIMDAPLVIPNDLDTTQYAAMLLAFTGNLVAAYNGETIADYTNVQSTFTVNQLQPSGAYSDYKVELSYNTNGVLEYYRISSISTPDHVIFSFERVYQNSEVVGEIKEDIPGYPLEIVGVITVITLIILKKRIQKK